MPVSGRSIETTKEGAARKHLFRRVWKLVGNANGNIFCSVSTFINLVSTVINLDHLNGDSGAIVDSDPGRSFRFGVTYIVGIPPTKLTPLIMAGNKIKSESDFMILLLHTYMSPEPTHVHTSYLSFLLHKQNFQRIKFTPKNA